MLAQDQFGATHQFGTVSNAEFGVALLVSNP